MNEVAEPTAPWAGVKFTCGKCIGEFQLEATDQCRLRLVLNDHLQTFDTPPCPTRGCGEVSTIEVATAPEVEEVGAS